MFKKNVKEVLQTELEQQPKDTVEVVRIKDIIIPQDFAKTTPLDYKMRRCRSRYNKLGYLDSPITVIAEINEEHRKNKLLLVNGYSRYLLAKKMKLTRVPVKYIDINTYCKERNI
jgi:hypothetical protein